MTLIQDIRYGARLLIKQPVFAAISVLTLAVGIGLTAMMFSIVYGVILRGLPFEDADRLMSVSRNNPSQGIEQMSVPLHDVEDWRAQQQAFEGIATYGTGTFNISGTEGAERYDGAWMSPNTFELLRVRPILGRAFREEEGRPGAEPVIVIGYRMWQDRFGGDPDVLGRTLRINGEEATIIGVMADGFRFPFDQGAWMPERRAAVEFARGEEGVPWLNVFGRLAPGVNREQANRQMSAIAARIAAEHPDTNEGIGAVVQPFTEAFIGREPIALLMTMLGAVFGVLLIACANVANLLLSRAALRAKEIGVRSALGARRSRIVLQFLTEPLALAAVGAVLGIGIAWLGVDVFNRAIVANENPPFWIDIRVDGVVLLFVAGLTLFATLASGVLPAIRASGPDLAETLKDDSRGSSSFRTGRLTKALVAFEVALSVTLLVGAGLMIKSVTKLGDIDYAFTRDNVFTARLGLPAADEQYASVESRIRFFEAVHTRLVAEPGLVDAALGTALPGHFAPGASVAIEGQVYDRPQDQPFTRSIIVTPGYFDTFGVGMVRGRDFGEQDRLDAPHVAIVNQSFVALHFPDGDAIGRRIRLGGPGSQRQTATVVGIVPDMHVNGIENQNPDGVYTPLAQESVRFMSIAVRTPGEAGALAVRVRDAVAAVDADIPIYWVRTLTESLGQQTWFYHIFGRIFMILGFVALFLAAIGLYGVMAFAVSRRTREMGVRIALGARAADVVRLVMRQGLTQLAIGVGIGLPAALGVAGLLRIILFQVEPRDPMVFGATILVLAATGILASWVPARRATRVDPMVALRYD